MDINQAVFFLVKSDILKNEIVYLFIRRQTDLNFKLVQNLRRRTNRTLKVSKTQCVKKLIKQSMYWGVIIHAFKKWILYQVNGAMILEKMVQFGRFINVYLYL